MGSELFGTQKDVTMLLHEANSELEALLSKLSPIIHRVQEHLLREESITYIKTKEYIDEIF
jgi:hypothetical protein